MADPLALVLLRLEEISRMRPDRVLRLRGELPVAEASAGAALAMEPFELLIFRGFSSSVTHPTAFDPDQPLLPASSLIQEAELLAAPLTPACERRIAGPAPVERFLEAEAWC